MGIATDTISAYRGYLRGYEFEKGGMPSLKVTRQSIHTKPFVKLRARQNWKVSSRFEPTWVQQTE